MEVEEIRSRLVQLEEEWRNKVGRTRSGLNAFRVYLMRNDHELYRAVQRNPRLLAELPSGLKRSWKGRTGRPLGKNRLKKYVPRLFILYEAERKEGRHSTFEDFLNEILTRYPTEEDLKKYLQSK